MANRNKTVNRNKMATYLREKIKELSKWRNHSCLYCEACRTCHTCDNSLCNVSISNASVSNASVSTHINRSIESTNTNLSTPSQLSSDPSSQLSSNESNSRTSNKQSSSHQSTLERSENCNSCHDRLHIDWKLQIYNNKFVYGISVATSAAINDSVAINESVAISGSTNNELFFLGQYTGPSLNLGTITLLTTTSALFFGQVNTNGEIIAAQNLWSYDGIREDYQFGQLQIDSVGNLIVLTTFVGTLTFSDGQTISEDDGNTMIGKFLQNGDPVWIRQITAKSIEDTYFDLDADNNIYVVGTFTGILSISDPDSPSITSNLESNMFVGAISSVGSTQWLLTATGSGYNTGEGITIHDNSVVVIGTFNDTFEIDNKILVNNDAESNMWVAKFNLDGDILLLTSPVHPNNNQETDFMDGGQIISHRGNLYIAGEMLGNYIFSDIDIDVELRTVFVTQLNSDLDFLWVSLLQVDIPTDNAFQPKLTSSLGSSSHDRIYLSNFGLGTVIYLNDEGHVEFKRRGSGSLDQIISELSLDGEWLSNISICGTVENFSIPLIANDEDLFVIGTHVINNERTDAFLMAINL